MVGVSPFPKLVDGLPGPDQPQVPPGDLLGPGGVPAHRLNLVPPQLRSRMRAQLRNRSTSFPKRVMSARV